MLSAEWILKKHGIFIDNTPVGLFREHCDDLRSIVGATIVDGEKLDIVVPPTTSSSLRSSAIVHSSPVLVAKPDLALR